MVYQVMGVLCLTVALILFFARGLNPLDGAKILTAGTVGLAVTTGHGFYNMFSTEVQPPLPLLILMALLTLAAFATAMKAKNDGADGA